MEDFVNRTFPNNSPIRDRSNFFAPSLNPVERTVDRAIRLLSGKQHSEGYWSGTFQTDGTLESEYVLLQAFLGRIDAPQVQQVAKTILDLQHSDGGWKLGSDPFTNVDLSVKSYLAIRYANVPVTSERLESARNAILEAGGLERTSGLTRLYLAMLGLIGFEHCPAIPPESIMAAQCLPIAGEKLTEWSWSTLVPISIVWAMRKTSTGTVIDVRELCRSPIEQWTLPSLETSQLSQEGLSWDQLFRIVTKTVKGLDDLRIRPLRKWAMRAATQWIEERYSQDSTPVACFPLLAWSRMAMRCLGLSDDSPQATQCEAMLAGLVGKDRSGSGFVVQPFRSPIRDTALALRCFEQADVPINDVNIQDAVDWLLKQQRKIDDNDLPRRQRLGDGWSILESGRSNAMMTAHVLLAIHRFTHDKSNLFAMRAGSIKAALRGIDRSQQVGLAAKRAFVWLESKQNRDGGWSAYDRDFDGALLGSFGNKMSQVQDCSCLDTTASVLECLAVWGYDLNEPFVYRGIEFLMDRQHRDGYWSDANGNHSVWHTWRCISALSTFGFAANYPLLSNAGSWLELAQLESGGWGERSQSSHHSSAEPRAKPGAEPKESIVLTACALMGLMAINGPHSGSVQRGVDFLVETQELPGAWECPEQAVAIAPRHLLVRSSLDPTLFATMALSLYRKLAPIVRL